MKLKFYSPRQRIRVLSFHAVEMNSDQLWHITIGYKSLDIATNPWSILQLAHIGNRKTYMTNMDRTQSLAKKFMVNMF